MSSEDVQAASTPSFVAALVTAAITVGGFLTFWLVFHGQKRYRRVFQPRTILAAPDRRADPLAGSPLAWFKRVFLMDDSEVLFLNGPDAYFFLRYIKVFGLYCMVPYVVISLVVCVPSSASKPNGGKDGLNILTFGNAPYDNPYRRLPHFFAAIILMLWTLYLIWREYNHYMEVRQTWLRSDRNSNKSRTVAMVNVPESMFSEAGIREIGNTVWGLTASGPGSTKNDGGITHVWLGRKVKAVEKVYNRRDKEVYRLEGGVGKLLKKAQKNQLKGKTPEAKGTWDKESPNIADRYVLPKKQPKWKQGFLGLFGKKMNLETSPDYILEQNEILEKERAKIDQLPEGNVAFVRFGRQEEAHNFARLAPKSDKALRMVQCKIEVLPEDIVWSNVSMSWYQRKLRTLASWGLTIGLIIIWAIPVAFVTSISNVDTICNVNINGTKPFSWICKMPKPVLGIVKGVLPPALMSVLFMLLPVVLRIWIKLQGEIRKSEIELQLFTRYWCFWVIHGFLITTLASGLMAALGNLGSTLSSIPTLLATKLPDASLYFLTFILVSTWATATKAFSRAIPWVMFQLRGFLAGGTPRKAFQQKYKMDSTTWSTTWPGICLLLCVTVVYSVIQPLITVMALVGFFFFYASYKYLLIWTADQPAEMETGGLYYIKALRTVFVALYLEQICLAGLFFLSTTSKIKDADGNELPDPAKGKRLATGLACGIIIVLVGAFTAVVQAWFDHMHFKRVTLMYGVRHTDSVPTNNSTADLNAAEKVMSAEEAKSPIEQEADEREFDHPALWKKQPCVWIADDPLGIGHAEAVRINSKGVEASTEFAHMNEKGQLAVDRSPPDEPWDNRPYDDDL